MRLDFKILWIDDQQKYVDSSAEGIRLKLRKDGFTLDVERVASVDAIDSVIGHHVHDDLVDLVLVDFNLGAGAETGGADAIKRVRTKLPYKDLVFYSADNRERLREIAHQEQIEGVFFAIREDLVDVAYDVISNLLRKVMDLDHMRGVVMAATSDIDFIVRESLVVAHGALNSRSQEAFLQKAMGMLEKKLKKYSQDLSKAKQKGKLEAVLKLNHICTADDRLKLLLEQISDWPSGAEAHLKVGRSYRKEVVPRRNALAHVVMRTVQGREVLESRDGTPSHEDMARLRRDLIDHRVNFQTLAGLVGLKFD